LSPSILIADDHPKIRQALRCLLSAEFPSVRLGEAVSGEEALCLCRSSKWDLVVLDLNLPGMFGMEVLERLKRIPVAPAVFIFSIEPRALYAEQSSKLGADAYFSKQDSPQELIKAVRRVVAPLLGKGDLKPPLKGGPGEAGPAGRLPEKT